jgi:cytidylate kinase
MGTVIFPDAQVKFFVEARVDVRAERRYQQLVQRGQIAVLEEIKRDIIERDHRDTTREVAPAKPAEGAVVIDNSDGTLESTIERMVGVVLGAR